MSIELKKMVAIIDNYLNSAQINDYCPNGLQIEGKLQVKKIVSGVTASQNLIDEAIKEQACVLLVHHGYFWKGENPCLVGTKKRRIKSLLEHEISLIGYHLPLDIHPEVGNNIQLAKRFNLTNCKTLPQNPVILMGELNQAVSAQDFADLAQQVLGRKIELIDTKRKVKNVAICSGGGQNYFELAINFGCDLFLTGEATEHNFHNAHENGINFIAAGHHATERFGVQALGDYLAHTLNLEHKFIDLTNPF